MVTSRGPCGHPTVLLTVCLYLEEQKVSLEASDFLKLKLFKVLAVHGSDVVRSWET